MKSIFTCILLAICIPYNIYSQNALDTDFHISNRAIQPLTDLDSLARYAAGPEKKNRPYFICRVTQQRAEALKKGLVIEDYLNKDWALAKLLYAMDGSQLAGLGIIAWSPLLPEDKIDPYLEEAPKDPQGRKLVLVAGGKGFSLPLLATMGLPEEGWEVDVEQPWKGQNIFKLHLDATSIATLATSPYIKYISPFLSPKSLAFNAIGFTNTQKAHQPISLGGYQLDGSGIMIGVGDNADPEHVDYDGRITSFNPLVRDDHGYHTTGTVGGNGIKDERFKGFANKCQMISDYFSQIIANAATYHNNFNMLITSNSYANIVANCGYAGTYDLYSQYVDQQAMDYPKLLNVFAAANDGRLTCSPFPNGYATLTGSFASAKNVLTVGAIGKTLLNEADYSSRGPVKDGRLKPEITAVGTYVISTISNNRYAFNNGTSMACPNVAGAAGLMYQRYKQANNGQEPDGALIKLLLMNGATDISTPGPDFRYGFGLMNLGHSLQMMDNNRYYSAVSNTNSTHNRAIQIPPNTSQLKVMLYWHDPAVLPMSTATLVNDLDLSLIAGSTIYLPWVLDPSPAMVAAPATRGIDRRNNVEQVTLDNPAAGPYTIQVKGFNVPTGNQRFYVCYDIVPEGIAMHYPFGGEALAAGDSLNIYWEASKDNQTFTVQLSIDNGGSWTTLSSNVPAEAASYSTVLPNINAQQCFVKVTRNNTSQFAQSKSFMIAKRPVVEWASPQEQCPGSLTLKWEAIPGINNYRVYRKIGTDMLPIATTSGTSYTLSGLSLDSAYWMSVAPIMSGQDGMRAVAIQGSPNSGSCQGIAHGDLSLYKIPQPANGRKYTSTQLSAQQPLYVLVKNFDGQSAAHYKISYQVGNGPWNEQTFTDPIAPLGSRQLYLGNINLSNTGTYDIKAAVINLSVTDPVPQNDTQTLTIYHLDNPPLDLSNGFEDGFEDLPAIELTPLPAFGLRNASRWDFDLSTTKGRLKTFVNSDITITGNRSISMDIWSIQPNTQPAPSYNTLTGTFNLSQYDNLQEIRCEFDYLLHDLPAYDTGNAAWVRGTDTDPWLPLATYQIDTNNRGQIFSSGSLSLTDILTAGGQTFSSSTQIKFTQYDTSKIGAPYFGRGLTLDNFKLYTVTNDIELVKIDSVFHFNCGLGSQVPMRLQIANRVTNTVYDIKAYYQLDGGPVVEGTIDSITGKDTVTFTFDAPMNLAPFQEYNVSAWVYLSTDTYRLNDSILDYKVRNQPIINKFPYLEDFEANDGYFYTDGTNSSWQYGTPSSAIIDHAASGTKAWKTSLEGKYNKNELSYLYSPCFDISGLARPMLSFHMASDIENPDGEVFDRAYVEYTLDGDHWQRLGESGEGTNWYDNAEAQAWAKEEQTFWQVASIPLPPSATPISFRFVLYSDQGSEHEGLAIDDIHIYDYEHPIFDQDRLTSGNESLIPPFSEIDFIENGDIALTILNRSSDLGKTEAQAYKHEHFINSDSSQYYLPKSFTLQSGSPASDKATIRFYIPDTAIKTLRNDQTCPSCSPVIEVQGLGVTTYTNDNKDLINNSLMDNNGGAYSFLGKEKVRWVPYGTGYYASIETDRLGEFWFNNGGPYGDRPINDRLFDFTAVQYGKRSALLNWKSNLNEHTIKYNVQIADATGSFKTIAQVPASGDNETLYTYIDTPQIYGPSSLYRILYELDNGTTLPSVNRSIDWSDVAYAFIYPNPVRNGTLYLEWFKGSGDGLQWSLYTSNGKQVLEGFTEENAFNGRYSFPLNGLGISSGTYFLKVVSGKQSWTFKVIYQE